jgi:preprotein translocase subunit SecB
MTWQLDSIIPPIQLENYFFTNVQFEAFPVSEKGKPSFPPIRKPVIRVSRLDDKKTRWGILLLVESEKPSEEKNQCFSFRLNIYGIFNWKGEEITEKNSDEIKKAIAVSGTGILFGSCREFLQTIVSKGPYPGYKLPAVRFVPTELQIKDISE